MEMIMTLLSPTTADTAANAGGMNIGSLLLTFIPLVGMIVVFYFLLIRPEKKRAKKEKEMRENIQVTDEVVTIGGIIGRVLNVNQKEGTVLIETGSDRNRIRVLATAIAENRTVHDEVATVTLKK